MNNHLHHYPDSKDYWAPAGYYMGNQMGYPTGARLYVNLGKW